MSRRLWGMVGAIVAVFASVSFLFATPAQVRQAIAVASAAAAYADRVGRAVPLPVLLAGLGGVLALSLTVKLLVRLRRQRPRAGFAEPWRTVVEMGRQGRSLSAISQATGLPQDAVRIVLSPVAVDPSLSQGKPFRPNRPSDRGATGRGPAGSAE